MDLDLDCKCGPGRQTQDGALRFITLASFVFLATISVQSAEADGSIVAWGYNLGGQCNVPGPNSGFVAVAGGGTRSLGLKGGSSIVAWGWNDDGQCNVPEPNTGFAAVAGGSGHSLGLKDDGSAIYDVSGRRVRILDTGDRHAGQWHVEWDGRSDLGESVSAGIYLMRLELGNETRVGRVVQLR